MSEEQILQVSPCELSTSFNILSGRLFLAIEALMSFKVLGLVR
jgi:hypothetical protein